MGDIAQKPLLPSDKTVEPRRHLVDRLPERAEFILPPRDHTHIETAFGDLARGLPHLADGTRDAV